MYRERDTERCAQWAAKVLVCTVRCVCVYRACAERDKTLWSVELTLRIDDMLSWEGEGELLAFVGTFREGQWFWEN